MCNESEERHEYNMSLACVMMGVVCQSVLSRSKVKISNLGGLAIHLFESSAGIEHLAVELESAE